MAGVSISGAADRAALPAVSKRKAAQAGLGGGATSALTAAGAAAHPGLAHFAWIGTVVVAAFALSVLAAAYDAWREGQRAAALTRAASTLAARTVAANALAAAARAAAASPEPSAPPSPPKPL